MKIEVVYASKEKQSLQILDLPEGSTVEQAIKKSSLLSEFPEIHIVQPTIGIFGKKTTLTTLLHPGDRVEIYRPLTIDPMQKRRRLAETQRKNKIR